MMMRLPGMFATMIRVFIVMCSGVCLVIIKLQSVRP